MMNGLMPQVRRAATLEVVSSRPVRLALAVVVFALLTALGAYAEVPVPGSPVPVTLQTLFVTLSGALLGPGPGAAAMALYLVTGALGAPVFSGGAAGFGWLLGPTGGYLLAFPAAAAVTGALVARVRIRGSLLDAVVLFGALLLGTAVIFAGGLSQLVLLTGDPAGALEVGLLPFVLGDLLKVLAATLVTRRIRNRTLALL